MLSASKRPYARRAVSEARFEVGDEREGAWTRTALLKMDTAFVAAVERAIKRGLERPPEEQGRRSRAA
jgi:hypothetical protein